MFKRFLRSFSVFLLMVAIGGAIGGGISVYILTRDLPDVSTLKTYRASNATEVYSADGNKIGEFSTERRYPVEFDSIPPHVSQAFIAAEDNKFYHHKGVDLVAFVRAAVTNVLKGKFAQGASTITQQVARGILLESRRKKISRKIREMILAYRMEQKLSKQEILSLYLNEIYLGHGAYGIGAAARNYFRKQVNELDVAEAAMLAGLPQRPADWDPFNNPLKAKQRQRYVLKQMVKEGFIQPEEGELAANETLRLYPLENINLSVAPYFVEYVRTYLMKKYGGENVLERGYKVYTSVRYDFQRQAERAVEAGLRETDKGLGWRGPVQHLGTPEKVNEFLEKYHMAMVEKIAKARLLPPNVEKGEALGYDLTEVEKPNSGYRGKTPVRVGDYYQAVVTGIDEGKKSFTASVGKTTVKVPMEGVDWVKVADQPLGSISQILVEGDVVEVKIEKFDPVGIEIAASLEQKPEIQGALLSYEVETGYVMAMVGGRSFEESEFNRALIAKRQVGSTFKPILYSAAIDKGFSPASIVTDSPLVFKFEGDESAGFEGDDWKPKNYTQRFLGEIPLRTALINSMNIPTIKILNEVGIDYAIDYARKLGIQAPFPRDLSIALGSWSSSLEDLMRAYAVFPRLGRPINLVFVQKVVDRDGKVLEENQPPPIEVGMENQDANANQEQKVVLSPQTAYVMTDLLKAVVQEGTARRVAFLGKNVAGKTGTSNDFHDAWFIGYTPKVMTGVWVGFDTSKPMAPGDGGGRSAAPIFGQYMSYVLKQYPDEDFPIPEDIEYAYIDKKTGSRATASTPPENRVLVAFKSGGVPNANGTNVARVPEPGVKERERDTPLMRDYTTEDPLPEVPREEGGDSLIEEAAPPPKPKLDDDVTDFLRQGYEE